MSHYVFVAKTDQLTSNLTTTTTTKVIAEPLPVGRKPTLALLWSGVDFGIEEKEDHSPSYLLQRQIDRWIDRHV